MMVRWASSDDGTEVIIRFGYRRVIFRRQGEWQEGELTVEQAHELHQALGAVLNCRSDACPCYQQGLKDNKEGDNNG